MNAYQGHGVQPQPIDGTTVKMKLGVWSVCEDQQSELYHSETQQVQKHVTKPELQLVERIDEVRS